MSWRLRERARGTIVLACVAAFGVIAQSACAEQSDATLGAQEAPPPFVAPEASIEPEEAGLTKYCGTDECPGGYTTCPLSNFRCDVNLLTDRNNCGACGVKCPAFLPGKNAFFECVDGECAMRCDTISFFDDCDGIVDNGCETDVTTDDNCKACGNRCDADKPCVDRGLFNYGCGCESGLTHCEGKYPDCLNTVTDDNNCGGCDIVCDPNVDGGPSPYPHTYYGCAKSKCGAVKCEQDWGDCDGIPENGCETHLTTEDNCAKCGGACNDGQACRYRIFPIGMPVLQCMCPAGQTFCPAGEINGIPGGKCYDLTSDPWSCGACGNACPLVQGGFNGPSGTFACVYGVCKLTCFDGAADCNGSDTDACEVNTNFDPNNCGACGNVCDAAAGQACVDGRCVVKPCDDVDGGVGAR